MLTSQKSDSDFIYRNSQSDSYRNNLWQTSCRRLFPSVKAYPCFPMLCNNLHEKKLYYVALIIVFTW